MWGLAPEVLKLRKSGRPAVGAEMCSLKEAGPMAVTAMPQKPDPGSGGGEPFSLSQSLPTGPLFPNQPGEIGF